MSNLLFFSCVGVFALQGKFFSVFTPGTACFPRVNQTASALSCDQTSCAAVHSKSRLCSWTAARLPTTACPAETKRCWRAGQTRRPQPSKGMRDHARSFLGTPAGPLAQEQRDLCQWQCEKLRKWTNLKSLAARSRTPLQKTEIHRGTSLNCYGRTLNCSGTTLKYSGTTLKYLILARLAGAARNSTDFGAAQRLKSQGLIPMECRIRAREADDSEMPKNSLQTPPKSRPTPTATSMSRFQPSWAFFATAPFVVLLNSIVPVLVLFVVLSLFSLFSLRPLFPRNSTDRGPERRHLSKDTITIRDLAQGRCPGICKFGRRGRRRL